MKNQVCPVVSQLDSTVTLYVPKVVLSTVESARTVSVPPTSSSAPTVRVPSEVILVLTDVPPDTLQFTF